MGGLTPDQVHYLAFEGGGGKGTAYWGAICALQQQGVLPIAPNRTNAISGLAGASAGAITALLLSLGYDATRIKAALADTQRFKAFFEDPLMGQYRAINQLGLPKRGSRIGDPSDARAKELLAQRLKRIDPSAMANKYLLPGLMMAGEIIPVPLVLELFVAVMAIEWGVEKILINKIPTDNPILEKIRGNFWGYAYNLLYDQGIFPGFAVRDYFQQTLEQEFFRRSGAAASDAQRLHWRTMDFRSFFNATGVNLVITGTNLTSRKSLYFSANHTPNFLVAEALGISMTVPFVFKPVEVEYVPPRSRFVPDPKVFRGRWVFGGILNNLPIHAFDGESAGGPPSDSDPDLRPLNRNVLALRLTPGRPMANRPPATDPDDPMALSQRFVTDLYETVLAPGEEGQLRTPAEADQTINLFTGDIDTLDFTPPIELSEPAQRAAFNAVQNYFAKATLASTDPALFAFGDPDSPP